MINTDYLERLREIEKLLVTQGASESLVKERKLLLRSFNANTLARTQECTNVKEVTSLWLI